MIDWDLVEDYTEKSSGIAFDGCHKIYVLMDIEQLREMRRLDYANIRSKVEIGSREMLETLKKWYQESCSLKFIEAVETNIEDPNKGFTTLIEQGATEHEECEDCNDPTCQGACYDDYEDENEEDIEEEDEEE